MFESLLLKGVVGGEPHRAARSIVRSSMHLAASAKRRGCWKDNGNCRSFSNESFLRDAALLVELFCSKLITRASTFSIVVLHPDVLLVLAISFPARSAESCCMKAHPALKPAEQQTGSALHAPCGDPDACVPPYTDIPYLPMSGCDFAQHTLGRVAANSIDGKVC